MSVNEMRIAKFNSENENARRLGIRCKYLILSLTCQHHSQLHSELLTDSEMIENYIISAAPNNCTCAVVQTLVDDKGAPVISRPVERAKAQRLKAGIAHRHG